MPTLTITNLTSSPVLVQELYASVPASGTLATERTQSDVLGMSSFLTSVAAGDLSYVITYSDEELAAGLAGAPIFANVDRPDSSSVATGLEIYNTDDTAPNYSDGTDWRDAAGSLT